AHCEPGSRRNARGRDDHRADSRRRRQDRDDDAQPRPGEAAGRRNPVPASGPAGRARAGRSLLSTTRVGRSRRLHTRRAAMVSSRRRCVGALMLMLALSATAPAAAQKFITVASTTSTEQSGLFKHMLPAFEKKTGIQVRVVALGTGQALDLARRGDADVVFVHARAAEDKFIAEGNGVKRFPVMYNDFVLIGPKSDPAKVGGGKDILEALKKIKAAGAPFVSRGDRSGTHMAELDLWKAAGVDLDKEKG